MTTWTPAAAPSPAWTAEASQTVRVFDPYVFDNTPIFDTGSAAGVWVKPPVPAPDWTGE